MLGLTQRVVSAAMENPKRIIPENDKPADAQEDPNGGVTSMSGVLSEVPSGVCSSSGALSGASSMRHMEDLRTLQEERLVSWSVSQGNDEKASPAATVSPMARR